MPQASRPTYWKRAFTPKSCGLILPASIRGSWRSEAARWREGSASSSCCLVHLGGEPLIRLAFGEKYVEAYGLLRIMTFSLFISMATFPLGSLLYMAGRHRAALVAEGLAVLGYGILLVVLIHQFGLIGAGFAYVAGMFMKALFALIPTVSSYNKRHLLSHHEEAT